MASMKAVVIRQAGGSEVLRIETVPIPTPQVGQVLIRVKAFGLNRSELFTRLGQSPSVTFPRILGIEAVGVVEDVPDGEFGKGDVVATAMGGMGGSSTAVTPNIHVCRRHKCKPSGPSLIGQ
jgi:NADPH:quinone reductase-like Zn-dependent oxidoreductase